MEASEYSVLVMASLNNILGSDQEKVGVVGTQLGL